MAHLSSPNTDWIFVIVQLHWSKRLSSRSFGSITPKHVGLIYKSIWYKIGLHKKV
jgi:hypothetical protein